MDEYNIADKLNKVTIEFERVGATMRIRFSPDVHPKGLVIDKDSKCSYAFMQLADKLAIQLVEEQGIRVSISRPEANTP